MASQRNDLRRFSCQRFEELFASSPRAKEIFASVYGKHDIKAIKREADFVSPSEKSDSPTRNTNTSLNHGGSITQPKSDYDEGEIIDHENDLRKAKDCNSNKVFTVNTPNSSDENGLSKNIEQCNGSIRMNNVLFDGTQDDEQNEGMDAFSNQVAIVLKKLDEVEERVTGYKEKTVKETCQKKQVLSNWSLRTVETGNEKQTIVEGHRRGDPDKQNWRSTVICERVSSRSVQTKSGSLYVLVGKIDEELMAERGFPKKFIKAFRNGFPYDWKRWLEEHFKQTQRAVHLKKENELLKGRCLSNKHEGSSEGNHKEREKVNRREQKRREIDGTAKHQKAVKTKASETISQQRQMKISKKSDLKTPPTSSLPKVEEVKRSRSGRIITPPLEYWRGERMIAGTHDDTISIVKCHLEENSVRLLKRSTPLSRKVLLSGSSQNKNTSLKEPRYNRNRAERKSKDYSSTEDVTTSGGEYNEESNKSASHTKSTVVKTLTYTKTSDSPSNDSEFPRNVHKTSKKAKDRRIETEETSEESDELGSRNELVVMKLAEQGGDMECNSEDETTSSRVIPAARRDEVVGSQDDNPTSDGAVTRDDHDGYDFDRSEGGSRTNVYGLRSRARSRSNKPVRVKDVKNGRKSPEDIFVALTPIKMEINPSTSTAIGKTTSIVSKGTKRSHCVQDANNEMGLSDLETKQTLSRVSGKSATKRRDENDFESLNVGKQGMRRSKSWKATLSHSNNDAKSSDTENNEMVHPVDSKTARKNRKEGEFQSLISMKRKMRLRMNSQKAEEQTEDSEVESSDAESGVSACSHRLRGRRATRNTKKDDLESLNVKNRKATRQVKNRAVANLTISEVQSSCIESKEMKTGSDKFGETVNEEKIHSENERTSSSVLSPKPMTKTSVNIKPNTRFQVILRHKNRGRDITTKKLDRAVSKEQGTRVLVTSENDGELRDKDTKVQGKMGTKQLGKTGIQKNRSNKSHNLCKKTVCTRSADTVTDEEMWDEDEHERLIGAQSLLPPSTAMYWQKVAQIVKTRSAEECQLRIQNQKGRTRPKKKISRKLQEKPVTEKLTAKVGTLARKRQLRDILEQQDDGYEDDIFDSTPFRNQRLVKFSPVNLDYEDVTEEVDMDPDDKTPGSRTPKNRLRPAGPLTASAASETEYISPGLLQSVNRTEVDRYVHQFKKRKLGRRNARQAKSHTPVSRKTSTLHPLSFDGDDCFNIREAPPSETEEEDYYWSDD